MTVDFHWHARDEEQSAQDTVAHSLEVAYAAGLDAIAAMPNTKKPLVTLERCREYLSLAPKDSRVGFFVHIGLTADTEQVKRAVDAMREEPRIIGAKMYWDHSTGNLGITKEEDQYRVLETLVSEGYKGVLVCHFEDPMINDDSLYNPNEPRTWSVLCREEISEYASFRRGVGMASKLKFEGIIHTAHVSTCETIDFTEGYRGPLKLSWGMTPHHAFKDSFCLDGPDGAHNKCNPPLRKRETQMGLRERLLTRKGAILESDHAPHTEEAKRSDKPPSGIASGTAWPFALDALRKLGMSEERVYDVTHANACKLYGVGVDHSGRKPDYARLEELQADYAFDPFAHLKQK